MNIGRGTQVFLGIYPLIGDGGNYALSESLSSLLHSKNIHAIGQVRRRVYSNEEVQYWLSTIDLDLTSVLVVKWDNYVLLVNREGIFLRNEEYKIVWDWKNSNGIVSMKKDYECIYCEDFSFTPK